MLVPMPTEADVKEARRRADKHARDGWGDIAWFWQPDERRYELRVMEDGDWLVLS